MIKSVRHIVIMMVVVMVALEPLRPCALDGSRTRPGQGDEPDRDGHSARRLVGQPGDS